MIVSEILQQVFLLRTQFGEGSGFTIRVLDRQYLITARHLLDNDGQAGVQVAPALEIMHDKQWKSVPCTLVGAGTGEIDIAVLALNQVLITFDGEPELGTQGMIFGQEVLFLGYPFGYSGHMAQFNHGYPLPYAKRGIVSMFDVSQDPALIIDGHNNVGFSGGPVAFKNQASGKWHIAAVVSGYEETVEPVFDESGQETKLTHRSNSGLIDTYPIQHALELIRQNPVGAPYSGLRHEN